MKFIYSSLFLLFITSTLSAQDIITLITGEEIKAKVLKILESSIEYKKWSNVDGPIYTCNKSDVFMIKYQNGEKDVFSSKSQQNKVINNSSQNTDSYLTLSDKNSAAINSYCKNVTYTKGKRYGKRAKQTFNLLWVGDESILETTELACELSVNLIFDRGQQLSGWNDNSSAKIVLKLRNRTSHIVYVDLGNSFLAEANKDTKSLYVPSSRTNTIGESSGVGLNMGAVTDILGIGGIVGTLARGTAVHTGTNTEQSVTTYAQRIIAVAPDDASTIEIPISIYYVPNTKVGDIYDDMSHIYHRIYLTYSNEESFTTKGCIKAYLYTKKMIGLHMTSNKFTYPSLHDCEDLKFPSGKVLYTGRYIYKRDN